MADLGSDELDLSGFGPAELDLAADDWAGPADESDLWAGTDAVPEGARRANVGGISEGKRREAADRAGDPSADRAGDLAPDRVGEPAADPAGDLVAGRAGDLTMGRAGDPTALAALRDALAGLRSGGDLTAVREELTRAGEGSTARDGFRSAHGSSQSSARRRDDGTGMGMSDDGRDDGDVNEPGATPRGRGRAFGERGRGAGWGQASGPEREGGRARGAGWGQASGPEREGGRARGAGWRQPGDQEREGGRGRGAGRGRPAREDGPPRPEAEVAREICLRQLAVRPRTRSELAKVLAKREISDEVIAEVLDRYDEVGMIDDAAFARAWVSTRHQGRGLARRALANELRQRGVDAEVAGVALESVDDEAEAATARALVDRKLRTVRGEPDAVFRKLVGMLARKGYSAGVAIRAVKDALAARDAEAAEFVEQIDPDAMADE
ncbi:hypothetical protein Acsp02_20200 [Actinoplanes sp. NBRC 103695]|nr:hypothetical protein Acsp02_20200 [Actinoplanes sp. NBRC 103695]